MNPKSNAQKRKDKLNEIEAKAPICCGKRTAAVFLGMGHHHPIGYSCLVCKKDFPIKVAK